MNTTRLRATIERRLLVNYRVDPGVLATVLPRPFRPALVGNHGMAGICLIRLGAIRPAGLPAAIGLSAENAAHRVAVEWDTPEGPVAGVYIPRRDTSSRLIAALGGRVFPGWHHLAAFEVDEQDGSYRIGVRSQDGEVRVEVAARVADSVMAGSVFAHVEEASRFFRGAPTGYAATPTANVFDGVDLETCGWGMRPLQLEAVASSFFEGRDRFPPGSAMVDSAFLMERLESTWVPQPRLVAGRMR